MATRVVTKMNGTILKIQMHSTSNAATRVCLLGARHAKGGVEYTDNVVTVYFRFKNGCIQTSSLDSCLPMSA